MAKLTQPIDQMIDRFGPHLQFTPPGGWEDIGEPDKLVKTHCCFCGVQCGIQLKVKDNDVVGFEPWEEFPLNKGMLCPKGVRRYLQGRHPDRLTTPLKRTPNGFQPETWDNANDSIVENIQKIQAEYGNDAFAVLSGASLTNEKSYLMGKFARVALKTKNIDYNGRLCMVSAGAANKMAFGIDRAANPWSDIPLAKCIIVTGSNVGECFPILTSYLWEARDNGAKIIVIDPRMTPIARTADLFLPVRPGRDSALMNGILHVCIKNGWIDEEFIEAHTNGFEEVRRKVEEYPPKVAEEISGVPAKAIEQAAEWWGTSATSILMHARGIEHHTQGTENCLTCINLALATGKIGKSGSGYFTITGQGNGQGAREHGQRCNQLPGARDIENPEHRAVVAERWGIDEAELPGLGMTATEMMQAIHDGKIKGLLLMCFNPLVSLPDTEFTRTALEKLDFFCVIDFFMSETARYADIVLPGSTQEEDEGTVTTTEGRVVKINKAVDPPGDARVDWEIICDIARRLSTFEHFPFQNSEDIFRELRVLSRGGIADYYGISYDRIEKEMGVFWPCPDKSHPGTPRLYEGGKFYHPDGKAKMHAVDYRPPDEDVDEAYPVILTTGRVVSQFLSGTQTRRIGPLVEQYPEPIVEIHPNLASQLGIKVGDWVRVESRRSFVILECRVVKSIRPDTIFIPYHWPEKRSANRLTNNALDPISKIPEFKVCAVHVEKSDRAAAEAVT
jgi:assimilatory nitrate reductase catalytic subunit